MNKQLKLCLCYLSQTRLLVETYLYPHQRSWVDVMYSPPFVCLSAGLLEKLWTDLNEIIWGGSPPPTAHLNFGGNPDSGSET